MIFIVSYLAISFMKVQKSIHIQHNHFYNCAVILHLGHIYTLLSTHTQHTFTRHIRPYKCTNTRNIFFIILLA